MLVMERWADALELLEIHLYHHTIVWILISAERDLK